MKPIIYQDELRNYLNDYARANNDADPLMWWKLHAQEFPNLSKMARDYLSIGGTSAPSERAFSGGIFTQINLFLSKGRRLITDTRSRLAENTIRACMCLKSWMK